MLRSYIMCLQFGTTKSLNYFKQSNTKKAVETLSPTSNGCIQTALWLRACYVFVWRSWMKPKDPAAGQILFPEKLNVFWERIAVNYSPPHRQAHLLKSD